MTQESLSVAAGVSVDMIGKIENGSSGARFPVIERLARALSIDAAELFSLCPTDSSPRSETFNNILIRLASLSEEDLAKLSRVLDALDDFRK